MKIEHVFLTAAPATLANPSGWFPEHVNAPAGAAAEAMRQELIAVAQQHLLELQFARAF